MKKEYEINDLLIWSAQQINKVGMHVSTTSKKHLTENDNKIPIWYILAMVLRTLLEIAKFIKEHKQDKNTIEIDFEEISNSFKKQETK